MKSSVKITGLDARSMVAAIQKSLQGQLNISGFSDIHVSVSEGGIATLSGGSEEKQKAALKLLESKNK